MLYDEKTLDRRWPIFFRRETRLRVYNFRVRLWSTLWGWRGGGLTKVFGIGFFNYFEYWKLHKWLSLKLLKFSAFIIPSLHITIKFWTAKKSNKNKESPCYANAAFWSFAEDKKEISQNIFKTAKNIPMLEFLKRKKIPKTFFTATKV